MVVVIQSQRNSYHARRGEQRREEVLQQAAELGQVKIFISCWQMTEKVSSGFVLFPVRISQLW